ncbi:hypothetical protein COV82_02715 [Candidatus Peregrinibacteria bacterium CG11_big_fil_rev_8_21_14_0_20_46_8]|nr:MAG: hypothetical protein COV82_02715 [Candidatus Peregrinibacteria bacterium CG11_big_fil_rev_8_21_14_0_20_46_8]
MNEESQFIPVVVAALVEDQTSQSPIVILHHLQSDRILPIWIGDPEARAIALALNKVELERPLTHNLLQGIIGGMGGKLMQVVVDRLVDKTYYASIIIQRGTTTVKVDARPSDSIALGLTAGVPILVEKNIMDEAGQDNPVRSFQPEQAQPMSEMEPKDIEKLKKMLKEARQREQEGSE